MPATEWKSRVRLHSSSGGHDPAALVRGEDLVLHAPRAHGRALAEGVLLDDHLSGSDRLSIDAAAEGRLREWRRARDPLLTVGGLCLPHVYEVMLYVDAFLRETRVVEGLIRALSGSAPRVVVLSGLDHELAQCLSEALSERGIEMQREGAAPLPSYPIGFNRPARSGVRARVTQARETAGLPGRVRGNVLILPWWHLQPLWHSGERAGLVGVMEPLRLPDLPPRALARQAAVGGWIGHPNGRDRRASRAAAGRAIASARSQPLEGDPLARLLDRRALRVLEHVGLDALARMRRVQPHFASGPLRTAVVPSDATPDARVIDAAARAEGRSTVHVQHGFAPYQPPGPPGHIDGMVSQRVGTWSEKYADYLRTGAPGLVEATGNAAAPAPPSERRRGMGAATLLLVEMPTPLSSRVGARVTASHLDAALEGLAAARPGTHVIVRPHPLDSEHRLYEAAAARHPDLELSMDARTPITELLDRVDFCLGAVSTAALQATVAGVPTVLLNVTGAALAWPFDGSDDYPVATDSEALAAAISAALAADEPPGLDAALTALGSDPEASSKLIALVGDAAG